MSMQLPPLAAIRAFEAAARHGSFTKAADELGMTQAAVSYQIKQLEDRVGAPLFLRRPRQVVLTDVGRRFAPVLSEAFAQIAEAYASVRSGARGTLSITTVQTFASHWLAPRLGSFQMAHPELAVRLDTSPKFADFAREDFDVAIRAGSGNWPDLAKHHVMPTDFTPMLSPELAASIGGVKEPADLLKLRIIDPGDPWWTIWLTAAGVSIEGLSERRRVTTGSQSIEASAAIAGQGIALLTPDFFRNELALGRLIQPFDLVCNDGNSYWLVYPEARRNAPKVKAFRTWLLDEIERARS
jgi:LysR family glycine cleavage system transcriptional activator